MRERIKLSAAQYISTPPEQRPAMVDVDAIDLMADLVALRQDVPLEVFSAAVAQINTGNTGGLVLVPEAYQGRLRIVGTRKERGG